MSDNIPFEIQMDIIQRIPDVKWVMQYRSVSKAWKSAIDSNKFVTAHTRRHHPAHNRLLIKSLDCQDCKACRGTVPVSEHCEHCNYTPVKYFSIVDDDVTFPHEKVSVPDPVEKLIEYDVTGSCHGLFCLYEYEGDDTRTAVIWNPSLRKTVVIPVHNVEECMTDVWFGVCPRNLDPKLVKITRVDDVNVGTHVEVFSLSSGGRWRSPLGSNVPDRSIWFGYYQVVVDGFIYWFALDRINVHDNFIRKPKWIMSFDLTSEEFTKVDLPDSLAPVNPGTSLSLYNLRDSLVVLEREFNRVFNREIYHVWMMIGHDCTRSFNKLYSINASPDAASIHPILGFRNTGAPIIEVDNDKEHYYRHERALAVYDPESKSSTNIGIYGLFGSFSVHSYMETLLLLDHRDIGQR